MIKKKSNLTNINKLITFNYFQIRNNFLFWILSSLCCISQLTIILCLHYFNSFYKYSLLIILIPLILSFFQIFFIVFVLFKENKNNGIEPKLICSKYSRKEVLISRILFIFITLLPSLVFYNLGSLSLIFLNYLDLFYCLLITNNLVNIFIFLIGTIIFVLIVDKLGKVFFLFLSIFLIFITLGMSLVTRLFIVNRKDDYFKYRNPLISQIESPKLVSSKNDLLTVYNLSENKISQESLMKKFNRSTSINNLIPSEWIISFYSSTFSLFNKSKNYNYSPYNLLITNVSKNFNQDLQNLSSFYYIRPEDENFNLLPNDEYNNIILNNFKKIINKHDLINDSKLLDYFNLSIGLDKSNNLYFDWNVLNFDVIDLLKDLSGINTEYNQLFYLLKYPELFSNKLTNLYSDLVRISNENIANSLYSFYMSPITKMNIFQASKINSDNLVLKTRNEISFYYPMNEAISVNSTITKTDIDFLKNLLVSFDENGNMQFLSNRLSYTKLSSLELEEFKKMAPQVKDQNSWSSFVDRLSLSYGTCNNFLINLQKISSSIFDYQLLGNSINLSNAIAIFSLTQSNQASLANIFIIGYILLFVLLFFLIFKKYKKLI